MDRSFFVLVAIVSIGSVLGWTGVLIWSAIEDGREQRRINDIRAERHDQADRYDQADFVRLAGCPVSDDNVRSLINELVAEGTREAHEAAQRIAAVRLTNPEGDLQPQPCQVQYRPERDPGSDACRAGPPPRRSPRYRNKKPTRPHNTYGRTQARSPGGRRSALSTTGVG